MDPKTATLEEAKAWLRLRVDEGEHCPCCTQFAKVYRRPMTSSMAYALVLIYRHFRTATDWLHVPSYLSEVSKVGEAVRGGDWAKLTHWGLLEEKPVEDRGDGSPRAGFYRLTSLGSEFVEGRARVQRHVWIYDGRQMNRQDDETIDIHAALASRFNYAELMRG
jgi:hypothetical protein